MEEQEPEMKIPKFKNESEEADWLYRNRNKPGIWGKTLRNKDGSPKSTEQTVAEFIAEQQKTRAINIRIPTGDLALAKKQAEAKGIGYQTYIRMLLHESLQKSG